MWREPPRARAGHGGANNMAATKLLYWPAEAATALGVGRPSLYRLLSTGALPSVPLGSLRRIPAIALEAYVAGLPTERPSSPDPED